MSTDYEYQYEDDYGGRILWGRVAFFGIALVLAFLLGTCVGGGDSALQAKLDEQEEQVRTLRAANDDLTVQLEGAEGGETSPPQNGAEAEPEGAQTPAATATDTAPPEGDAEQTETTYTVQPNDTLYTIAQSVYGNGAEWRVIAEANNLSQDDHIRVGQELRIPPKQ